MAIVLGGLLLAPEPPPWWRLVLAVAAVALAQQPVLHLRVGAAVLALVWGEAAVVVGLVLVPAGWLPLTFAVGTALGVGVRRLYTDRTGGPSGAVRSAAALAAAAAAAATVGSLVTDPYASLLTPLTAAALALAALTYLFVATLLASVSSALRFRMSTLRLLRRALTAKGLMFAGNVALGLTLVAVASADWRWLLVLPLAGWLLHRTYAHRLRVSERRRMWGAFARATRSLNQPDEAAVALAGIRGALEVFAVGRVEVELTDAAGGGRAWMGDQSGAVHRIPPHGSPDRRGPWLAGADPPPDGRRPSMDATTGATARNPAESAGFSDPGGRARPAVRPLERHPAPVTTVPLTAGTGTLGQLRVHFPRLAGPGHGEEAALKAYADALAAAVQDAVTHQEVHRLLTRSAAESQRDPLTGLFNRAALLTRGETAVQLSRAASGVGLLLVDVDHFREINDTLGHEAGDEVLKVIAHRLRAVTRPGELLARLGGDEFALLVTDPPRPSGRRGGPRITYDTVRRRGEELATQLAEEADIRGVPVSVGVTVGVVAAASGTADLAELLRRADVAVGEARQRRTGPVGCYEAETDPGRGDRPALLAALRTALNREDELRLVLQPVVDLTTGAPIGLEALVRWEHPQRGELPPAEFIRVVENSDLLERFTEYVVDRALAVAAAQARRGPAIPVAVNLSARSLLDPRLPGAVGALLRKHRVPGRRLILEITETVVASELPGIEEALARLRALGVRLAVDDFGTGHASLAFLTRVPLDEVKVDGSFVAEMHCSAEAAAIVRATVELGRELGLRVVAEGVETPDQRRHLSAVGCTAAQGYHLAPPVPPEQLGEALRTLTATARGEASTADPPAPVAPPGYAPDAYGS